MTIPNIVCPICKQPCTRQDVTSVGRVTTVVASTVIDLFDAIQIESWPCECVQLREAVYQFHAH